MSQCGEELKINLSDDKQEMYTENKTDLDTIFEEKLYVSKRKPFTERTNIVTSGKTRKDAEDSVICKEYTKQTENTKESNLSAVLQEDQSIHPVTIPYEHNTFITTEPIPNPTQLQELYDDVELSDVYKTKQLLEQTDRKVTFDLKVNEQTKSTEKRNDLAKTCKENTVNEVINKDSTNKIKTLEHEFNLMIKTQKDALKVKSKVYQFVYSEILAIRREFQKKVEEVEAENERLKTEMEEIHKQMESMSNVLKNYKQEITRKANVWKEQIEKQVKVYLKERLCKKEDIKKLEMKKDDIN